MIASKRQPRPRRGFGLAFFACLLIGVVSLMGACSVPPSEPTPAPTFTLVPAPATATHTPTLQPTATLTALPSAAEIAQTRSAPPLTDSILEMITAQVLVDLTQRVGEGQALTVLAKERVTWRAADLECGDAPRAPMTAIAGFKIVVLSLPDVYEYHTDASGETIHLCAERNLYDDYPQEYIQLDPTAGEFVLLAQERLSRGLDLPVHRIRLVSVRPVTWQDRQLGCAREDAGAATPIPTQGYRIVLGAGSMEYIFHTDLSALIVQCDEG